MTFFTEIEKNNPKLCMDPQKTTNSQSNLKKEQRWRHRTFRFKPFNKATAFKVAWHKNRHIDQWDRTESLEINQCIQSQLFDKGAKKTHGKRIISLINGATETGYPYAKNELDPCLTPFTKVNSRWIKT